MDETTVPMDRPGPPASYPTPLPGPPRGSGVRLGSSGRDTNRNVSDFHGLDRLEIDIYPLTCLFTYAKPPR